MGDLSEYYADPELYATLRERFARQERKMMRNRTSIPPVKTKPQSRAKNGMPTQKFYVAADSVTQVGHEWAQETMADAVEQATAMLNNDPTREEVFIVKIVGRVRRKAMPIVVDVIK